MTSWTKTPPTESGFYFVRSGSKATTAKAREVAELGSDDMWWLLGHDNSMPTSYLLRWGYEFWPEPIRPPVRIEMEEILEHGQQPLVPGGKIVVEGVPPAKVSVSPREDFPYGPNRWSISVRAEGSTKLEAMRALKRDLDAAIERIEEPPA